jgi:hypothetical protein
MKREVTLRRVARSVFLTIPADFVKAYRLSPGDVVTWEAIDDNGATLRFFRVTTSRTPALRADAQASPVPDEVVASEST